MKKRVKFRGRTRALRNVVELLNSKDPVYGETRQELLKLTTMWTAAKRSGQEFLRQLWAGDAPARRLASEIQGDWKALLIPSDTPPSHANFPIRVPLNGGFDIGITPSPRSEQQQISRKEIARFHFLTLLAHPQSEMLGGPCAWKPCSRYYIMRTKRQTVYCSRKCANKGSAADATRRMLDKARQDKLARASKALAMWAEDSAAVSWKVFVSSREKDITPSFLTRAANLGELRPPHTRRERRKGRRTK
jgi:hypothetical protein